VLAISVTSVHPARAAKLANAVADAYVVDKLDARFESAKRASAWLSDRLLELRKQLRESEEAVAQFRTEHGLIQSSANVTLGQQQLSELNAKLIAARADTAEKRARLDLLNSIEAKGGNAQSLESVGSTQAVANLRQQEASISQKEADLVARYSDRHPLVVNIRAERRDVQRAINAEVQRMAAGIKTEYELAKAREEAIERSFQEATGQTGIDNRTAITLRELERTAAVNKNLFEDFLQKAKITEEKSTFEVREARVITPALAPGGPSYPRKEQVMALALVIGLILGVGGAVAKEKLNSGFTTPKQVEEMLEMPLLTSVSRLDQRDLTVHGKVVPIPHYPAVMPLSRFGESMRALRSGIQMTDVDNTPKVIQLTSTMPDEGKTTIALSLAVSAATSGLKVLFIDADLRHPSASRFLNLPKEVGLVDLLLGAVNPQDVIRFHQDVKMWMIPAGSRTQNPADLLGSDRMKSFVARCKESFDFVVIDTPPIGPVIDPIIVSHFVDKIVYVVRWAVTSRELVKQSVQRLPGRKKLAGIAFNHVDEKQAQKYGKYAYSYYYGSRYYKKYYNG
jgi:capsular exopolysaccharide synthesis family protein